MAQKYNARDRTVQKMSRDGLTRENLRTGETEDISKRIKESSAARQISDSGLQLGRQTQTLPKQETSHRTIHSEGNCGHFQNTEVSGSESSSQYGLYESQPQGGTNTIAPQTITDPASDWNVGSNDVVGTMYPQNDAAGGDGITVNSSSHSGASTASQSDRTRSGDRSFEPNQRSGYQQDFRAVSESGQQRSIPDSTSVEFRAGTGITPPESGKAFHSGLQQKRYYSDSSRAGAISGIDSASIAEEAGRRTLYPEEAKPPAYAGNLLTPEWIETGAYSALTESPVTGSEQNVFSVSERLSSSAVPVLGAESLQHAGARMRNRRYQSFFSRVTRLQENNPKEQAEWTVNKTVSQEKNFTSKPGADELVPDLPKKNSSRLQRTMRKKLLDKETFSEKLLAGAEGEIAPKVAASSLSKDIEESLSSGAITIEQAKSINNRQELKHAVQKRKLQKKANRKIARKRLQEMEQPYEELKKKKPGRLKFDDEGGIRHGSMKPHHEVTVVTSVMTAGVRKEMEGSDNVALESLSKSEAVTEVSLHKASLHSRNTKLKKRSSGIQKEAEESLKEKLRFGESKSRDAAKDAADKIKAHQKQKADIKRFYRKKRQTEAFKVSRQGEEKAAKTLWEKTKSGTAALASKAKDTLARIFGENKKLIIGVGVIGILMMFVSTSLMSCSTGIEGVLSAFAGTTYPSETTDIHNTNDQYSDYETDLNEQINNIESTHPGYDEYRYVLDQIYHNPFELTSYLSAMHQQYTFSQVQGDLQALFQEQYTLELSESEEIRTRTVTHHSTDPETGEEDSWEEEETYTVKILNVHLKNKGFDAVARDHMTAEQTKLYDAYNNLYGNRPELFSDTGTEQPGSGQGGAQGENYSIPSEALSDEQFAGMIHEAEKYLGRAYVWGGSSPSTGFDCSGFVCWVINHSGNGWNVGRTTAEGIRQKCSYVSPSEAKPGDIIFFQGTYDTPGASHVGIYVGNNMMIHCGDPIKYSSISTSYWQNHFYQFGRLSNE